MITITKPGKVVIISHLEKAPNRLNSLQKHKINTIKPVLSPITTLHKNMSAENNNITQLKCIPLKNPSKLSKFRTKATSIDLTTSEVTTPCPRGKQWQIHKFGGTCMASAERIRIAAELIIDDPAVKKAVIVSAMGSHPSSPVKVTDLMLRMIDKATRSDYEFMTDLEALHQKYEMIAKQLIKENQTLTKYLDNLQEDVENLKAMLHAIAIAGTTTEAFSDFVVGHGEIWCAQLMTLLCQEMGAKAEYMDSRDILLVSPTADKQSVDVNYEISNKRLDKWTTANGVPDIIIITGFIARNPAGQATTLKRNGSDYSATIFGNLFKGSKITIWTDVDGVYSADPRKVKESFCLSTMTYNEAWELSYFGANVLHPRTTLPAMKENIPITIRNFFNLNAPGTDIIKDIDYTLPVKGFATIDNLSLINVEGTGMAGIPGIASKVFTAMKDAEINVIMISQASSEQSICFAVKDSDSDLAVRILNARFVEEINSGNISQVTCEKKCSILAAVGQQMANRHGVAAQLMKALSNVYVNIKAIAQGSSEYNITVLIDQKDSKKALQAVHSEFHLSKYALAVGLVGPGLIGGTLLSQIKEQNLKLKDEFNIDFRILAIADIDHMLLSDTGVNLEKDWKNELEMSEPTNMEKFTNHMKNNMIGRSVIVDTTASKDLPNHYLDWIKHGIHVITPNKRLGSGPLDQYKALHTAEKNSSSHWLYEATVGAGLPVLGTLRHLIDTGDKILKIEGILSGTLSYIFNELNPDKKFSDVVKEAMNKGFTEPDPRDDLSGTDVARKVVILARECGLELELEDVPVYNLVPKPLQNLKSIDDFFKKLPEFDEEISKELIEAEKSNQTVRFVGVVDCASKSGKVEIAKYLKTHPFSNLHGSDNIISFTTERYFQQPLIVRGPGAGAEVTAAGVFADLLKLASFLGASA